VQRAIGSVRWPMAGAASGLRAPEHAFVELRDNALDAASHSEGHEQSPKDSTMSHRPTQHASFRTIDRLRCIAGLALGIGLLAARTGRAEPTQPPPAPQATAAAASLPMSSVASCTSLPRRPMAIRAVPRPRRAMATTA
jgi:hypothetical protein